MTITTIIILPNKIFLLKNDQEARAIYERLTKRGCGGANNLLGSNQHEKKEVTFNNVQDDQFQERKAPVGNSAAAGMRRLQKEAEAIKPLAPGDSTRGTRGYFLPQDSRVSRVRHSAIQLLPGGRVPSPLANRQA